MLQVVVQDYVQGDIATSEVGFVVPCGTLAITMVELVQALIMLNKNQDLRKKKSGALRAQADKYFRTSCHLEHPQYIYSKAVKNQNVEQHLGEYNQ